jgi:hypothetical protein
MWTVDKNRCYHKSGYIRVEQEAISGTGSTALPIIKEVAAGDS